MIRKKQALMALILYVVTLLTITIGVWISYGWLAAMLTWVGIGFVMWIVKVIIE